MLTIWPTSSSGNLKGNACILCECVLFEVKRTLMGLTAIRVTLCLIDCELVMTLNILALLRNRKKTAACTSE